MEAPAEGDGVIFLWPPVFRRQQASVLATAQRRCYVDKVERDGFPCQLICLPAAGLPRRTLSCPSLAAPTLRSRRAM